MHWCVCLCVCKLLCVLSVAPGVGGYLGMCLVCVRVCVRITEIKRTQTDTGEAEFLGFTLNRQSKGGELEKGEEDDREGEEREIKELALAFHVSFFHPVIFPLHLFKLLHITDDEGFLISESHSRNVQLTDLCN